MTADLISTVWDQRNQCPDLAMTDWELLLGQARRTGLLARLAQQGLDCGWLDQVPTGPRQYLQGALRLVERQKLAVQWEVNCIRRALSGLHASVVLLKGAAYVMADLPPARSRLFSDIDIMVARDRLTEVEAALFAAGWISAERDAYNQRYYRTWMHEIPPLKHVQRNTVLDLHHTISPPTSRFKVNSTSLFDQIRPIENGSGLFTLSPTDMVLHSAVHLFQEGEFGHGLRDLLDLDDLIKHFASQDGTFWIALLARAQELGLGIPLSHTLVHLQRLFGTAPPAELQAAFAAVRPGWTTRKAMSVLLGAALRPQHPSCDTRFSGIARWMLYVRSHYIRMPAHLIIPHLLRKAYMRQFPEKTPRAP
ncbi:nucleotidyltransferase family protein [Rhodoferax sp.]|uniref:nucleotidyltransferase domain-containing protein n=1 Tax=Rhodoferax sp. TaxID=50421 RepID=UPI00274928F2|nr:nucleotidyltransferase family protein [Rhodoferax sp.]